MSQPDLNCPKCGGGMEVGFVIDHGDYGSKQPSDWVEGAPVKSFWHGGTKISDKRRFAVETYRCTGCGYLESYAAQPSSRKSSLFT